MGSRKLKYTGVDDRKDEFLRIVADFEELMKGPGLVKNDVKSTVVRIDSGNGEIYCKRFNHGGTAGFLKNQLRISKALRSLRNAERAREKGIPVVRHLAAVDERGPLFLVASYLISEAVTSALPLQMYIKTRLTGDEGTARRRRAFSGQLAGFVAGIHSGGLVHGDLKGTNILVKEATPNLWGFRVLDMDDVRFTRDVPIRSRIGNLVQINNDCMCVSKDSERLAFLSEYLRESGLDLTRDGKRGVAREIVRLTALKVERWHREEEKLTRRGTAKHRDDSMNVGGREDEK